MFILLSTYIIKLFSIFFSHKIYCKSSIIFFFLFVLFLRWYIYLSYSHKYLLYALYSEVKYLHYNCPGNMHALWYKPTLSIDWATIQREKAFKSTPVSWWNHLKFKSSYSNTDTLVARYSMAIHLPSSPVVAAPSTVAATFSSFRGTNLLGLLHTSSSYISSSCSVSWGISFLHSAPGLGWL